MSSVMRICPSCGFLGNHTELTEDQEGALAKQMIGADKKGAQWHRRGYFCSLCGLAYLAVWACAADREKVQQQAGIDQAAAKPTNGRVHR